MGKKKKKGTRKRRSGISLNLANIGIAINAAYQTGIFSALGNAIRGDFKGAAKSITSRWDTPKTAVGTLTAAALPAIVVKVLRWTIGPMPVINGRRIRVRLW